MIAALKAWTSQSCEAITNREARRGLRSSCCAAYVASGSCGLLFGKDLDVPNELFALHVANQNLNQYVVKLGRRSCLRYTTNPTWDALVRLCLR